ncbi:uncharacterized protein FPRO_16145 [Fusarium proliferatum ET1]|uniref:Uncharacterized protein n=1 Tax=Fusarium proliferatum (strain ET1) TaxID=1227346 RepID=A0A1L7WBE5_FUSPR|nr:uncharacterized protein FPRO_16145 [Fusarium proliferatum ET1]CZR49941.1 uncharacterized protein FPRO_16145 [Fusarium proliferatum ET1]
METTTQPVEQPARAHQDQLMIDMILRLRHAPTPRPRHLVPRQFRPRSTRPARSPRTASSVRLAQSSRARSSNLPINHSSGRPSKDDLFWPPSQVTNAQLSDPATRILINTKEATLVSCLVNGGTMYYFGAPSSRKSRARR